ncbi:MAG: hydrolase, TatD family [Blastococcus sp.]|nr:hydrolase, TatD family [Blastococcus sp.]
MIDETEDFPLEYPGDGPPPPDPAPLAVPVIDSHCHLDYMGGDVEAHLRRARSAGVEAVVQIGIDVPTSQLAADLAVQHESVWAAAAIHPNEAGAGRATAEALGEIERLARLPHVRAVGETGLDHVHTEPDGHGAQEESFRAHIAIAKSTGTTLVIHNREAHRDVLRILDEEGAPDSVVFHCFSGDEAMVRACAARDFVMSFAGNLTFGNGDELRRAAALAPLHQILVETDAPFMTPRPWNGRPNAPYLVPHTVRAIAAARNEDLDELCDAIARTGKRVFGL